MHGGMKVYAGSPTAARNYVEADRCRADDYYLAEGTGIACRYTAAEGRVAELAALTVAHHTSRAGDPHRHLHLQINARVFATGKWRGLHTVGVRDSLAAINGIGHAAMACDPQFRAALATHGYVLDGAGEIRQL